MIACKKFASIALIGLLAACGGAQPSAGPLAEPSTVDARSQDAGPAPVCQQDSDCVPDACCHATGCVPASAAPACEGVSCTRECRWGTVHCGKHCACVAGQCAVAP